jgi:hypothetical protein
MTLNQVWRSASMEETLPPFDVPQGEASRMRTPCLSRLHFHKSPSSPFKAHSYAILQPNILQHLHLKSDVIYTDMASSSGSKSATLPETGVTPINRDGARVRGPDETLHNGVEARLTSISTDIPKLRMFKNVSSPTSEKSFEGLVGVPSSPAAVRCPSYSNPIDPTMEL